MTQEIDISIPMPLVVSIEDVGWWSGWNGSGVNQPFRTGMPRDHVPADYTALAALGKGLGTRILAGFVLCEWDKTDSLRHLPSATWMGDKWVNPMKNREHQAQAAAIIKAEQDFIEFGFHALGHEFWSNGRMERSEFHNTACQMRDREEIIRHLDAFFRIMEQHGFDVAPRTFIPPALYHSFGNGDKGFQKIMNRFGIKYVTLVFNRAKLFSRPQAAGVAWENDVLLVERGEADVKWDTVAAEPHFLFDRPVMALHWANILHPDPRKNLLVVDRWVRYINETIEKTGGLLARDSESAFTQYLHKTMSKIQRKGRGFSVDMSWLNRVPGTLIGASVFLKVDAPGGIGFDVSGARKLAPARPAETPFLKLSLPEDEQRRIRILLRQFNT
ncbi:MAG TPA: hypothetical protein DHV36_02340, partial [Desulfobacteraceae bacterium]|mgnify:CR=1 FL=1|nr:hypothetical protein [Desulfobacteraceae bacterium]|tara:strand:+ start:409 stop:1569 length:1161 start_codon:yes stop_codon:yes gene_type:complete